MPETITLFQLHVIESIKVILVLASFVSKISFNHNNFYEKLRSTKSWAEKAQEPFQRINSFKNLRPNLRTKVKILGPKSQGPSQTIKFRNGVCILNITIHKIDKITK